MITEIRKEVYLLRYEKSQDDLFEGCWPINKGVSINSYIVLGKEKKVLIDYVEDGADFDEDLASIGLKLEDFDVLILNHMEPDHTGGLNKLFVRCPNIMVYATTLGCTETKTLYNYNNVHAIKNGEELDIGEDKITFYFTPNIHWPDTMMSLYKDVLFSCDAFGAFGSYKSVFDDELTEEEWELLKPETERYYANIVSSFSPFVIKGIAALASLPVKTICPSHGIVWRKNSPYVIDWYSKLASYLEGPREKEITILYSSMYGNTLAYIEKVKALAVAEGIITHLIRIPDMNNSYALEKAWRSEGLVIAAPTYEMSLFPSMAHTLDLMCRKDIKNRKVIYFGSSLWSGGAAKEFASYAEKMKLDVLASIEFRGKGTSEDEEKILQAMSSLISAIK